MPTALIVGASRGIGAELAGQYVADGWAVHATVRDPAAGPPGATAHLLDVRDHDQLEALVAALEPVDLVIHNAGVYRGVPPGEMLEVNTEAPLRLMGALLEAGRVRAGGVAAFMSSGMGSRRGRAGLLGPYGESKAQLNDGVRARAAGWLAGHGVVAVVLNPGWVRTDMGGPGAPLAVEDSVAGMRRVLAGIGPADAGRFLTWDGREQPW